MHLSFFQNTNESYQNLYLNAFHVKLNNYIYIPI